MDPWHPYGTCCLCVCSHLPYPSECAFSLIQFPSKRKNAATAALQFRAYWRCHTTLFRVYCSCRYEVSMCDRSVVHHLDSHINSLSFLCLWCVSLCFGFIKVDWCIQYRHTKLAKSLEVFKSTAKWWIISNVEKQMWVKQSYESH